ncbi:MAG: hypothetical protein ACO33A_02850 [Hyphomonas sp.]
MPAEKLPSPDVAQPAPEAAAPAAPTTHPVAPRPFLSRAFSVTPGQALRLFAISTLTGFFVLAFDFRAEGARFDIGGALTAIIHLGLTAIGWTLESLWKPALAGALVVLPIWAVWRVLRMLFRK